MIEIPKNDIEQKKRESVGQQPNILDVFINAGLPLQINQENNTSMEQSFNVS